MTKLIKKSEKKHIKQTENKFFNEMVGLINIFYEIIN